MRVTLLRAGLLAAILVAAPWAYARTYKLATTNHHFKKQQLSDQFFGEGANFADFNQDGAGDIVSGPYWYAGPTYKEKIEYYPAKPFDINGYSDNFFAFTHDFNGDEWADILIIGFPGKEAFWYENPQGKAGHWKQHLVIPVVDNESPTFTDVTGDGQPDLVCMSGGFLGYAEIPKDDPTQRWKFHPVSSNNNYHMFTHGLGVGDVNADGRMDLLVLNGWWEQPAQETEGQPWPFHAVKFSEGGGADMYAYDFDGDGDNDVVTSKAAHAYGLSWFENTGAGDGGEIAFKEHQIMGDKPEQNPYGVAFSQLHAVELVDVDGDGLKDIVTGKRYWAHSEHDPGSLDPAVLYWFQTVRKDGKVHFVPHMADDNSGVGTQLVVGDVNGDKLPDFVVGSKKGTFVLTHEVRDDDAVEKENDSNASEAQPKDGKAAKPQAAADEDGFRALAEDGHVLNLDFETGDLTDWKAEGTAFDGQPIKGDTVKPRRAGSVSGHQGEFWIGTFEPQNHDGLQGLLTSAPFTIDHPYASFLVGGGSGGALGAEIVLQDGGDVIFRASGRAAEEMQPAVADLRKHLGKKAFIRIVDSASAGWGHTNFDHFRLHDEPPAAKAPQEGPRLADDYPYAGLSADEAAQAMKLPEGFKAIVSAAEPDVKQPIAMAIDDRGRVWVAEAYEYPVRAAEGQGRDRILIFEDVDGDGKFDKHKVFADKLNLVSGLEVGFGGVWVGAAPNFMFIPDRNGDDVPDGEPEILLDGWAYEDTHETLNTFIWGPDGWLYGCHGVFTHSRVGKPGTPQDERTPLNAAIWRYHPTRHAFEVFSEGTSNPWGVDFDDYGQAFSTACVIPHLYYNIPGGRYQRQAGSHFNPHTYADIQTIADHRHYLGDNPHGGNGNSGDAGGGHAHCGAMIYLGDAWPDEFRGRIFMNNIHGQRLNTDVLTPRGSGYVGSHGPDFLLSGDLASQILNIRYGPDGQAWMIDWYDTNACHHHNVEGHDRTNGRIYKIVYGDNRAKPVDLQKLSDAELANLALHKNDWYVRHSRRLLQERAAAGKLDEAAREDLVNIALNHRDATRRLRALWALHVTGGVPGGSQANILGDPDPYVRSWMIRLAVDVEQLTELDAVAQFATMAGRDDSQVVRLHLASAAQSLPVEERWPILEALAAHGEDAQDHNLPLMYWYAAEPLAEADPERALAWGLKCGKTIPLLREFMIRRIASIDSSAALTVLLQKVAASADAAEQLELLQGLGAGLKGQRQVAAPANWPAAFAAARKSTAEVREEAIALGVKFGDQSAIDSMRAKAAADDTDAKVRRDALQALLAAKDSKLPPILLKLIARPDVREDALSGLSMYDDEGTPAAILAVYGDLSAKEKRAALATLCSRAPYGVALLRAIEAKQVPTADLTAELARQLQNHKNEELNQLLVEVWGTFRKTPAEKAEMIGELRRLLVMPGGPSPDVDLGRAVFAKTCQTCHILYGVGAKIGPDITGANRSDLDYLLSNIGDPSSVITKEYQQTVVMTVDGLVVSGILKSEDDNSITMQTATEQVVIPKEEIEDRQLSEVSMMPDDQLKQYTPFEIKSLFAYLQSKAQTPMLARKDNQELLFNGKDLNGWTGDADLWSVEDGEIVGRSPGIEHNSFLFSDLTAENFHLSFEIKLLNDVGNTGVQFRSEPVEGGEAKGYQADGGPGWWGKLYEESGRALLWDKSGEQHIKKGQWNKYEVRAVGSHIQTWINGEPCVDLDDPEGKRRGVFALQIHSGEAMEVRFRNLKLEVIE